LAERPASSTSTGRSRSAKACAFGDADREPVGVLHVDRDELDARLFEAEQEVSVPGKPVELRDHQLCIEGAARGNRGERRPVVSRFPLSTSTCSATNCQLPPLSQASTAARCASSPRPLSPCRLVETPSFLDERHQDDTGTPARTKPFSLRAPAIAVLAGILEQPPPAISRLTSLPDPTRWEAPYGRSEKWRMEKPYGRST
jgi:hypothetical protein